MRRTSGFMLLDLALALTVLLLMFAVVWPLVGSRTNSAQQAATALDIALLLRADRTAATRDGIPTGTRIDLARRVITGAGGRQVRVPSDVAMDLTTGTQCIEGARRFVILFAPDGSSCGGVLTLRRGNLTYAVRINWLSGMIDVLNVPKA
jgi:general secretion pathway protein H